jgi:small subunit ribosomal protein S14
MKNLVQKDKRKRQNYFKIEKNYILSKGLYQNRNLSESMRWIDFYYLSVLSQKNSLVKIKNRCVLTGRGRFLSRHFRLSRLALQKLARNGKISGLRKSSW